MKLYYIAWPDGRKEGPMPQDSLFYGMVHGVYKESCLVWTDGMESWDALYRMFPLPEVKRRRRSLFSLWKRLTGLEGLSVIEFFCSFSQVFRRHSLQEVIELTASGTDHTTPSIHELSPTWPKPWLYVRIALFFLILYIISSCGFYCLEDGNNMNYVPLHLLTGCMGVPLSVMMFFYECNKRRNLPFWEILKAFMLGGVLSLFITAVLNLSGICALGAISAGPVEETAKLLAAILIASAMYKRDQVHHGLIIGCAVGAGFAVFESMGYAFRYFCTEHDVILYYEMFRNGTLASPEALYKAVETSYAHYQYQVALPFSLEQFVAAPDASISAIQTDLSPNGIMIIRSILSPLCHVVWTALTAAAFWHVVCLRHSEPGRRRWEVSIRTLGAIFTFGLYLLIPARSLNRKVDLAVCADHRFLWVFCLTVFLHSLWNSPLSLFQVKICIGVISWLLALMFIQLGVNRIRIEQAAK